MRGPHGYAKMAPATLPRATASSGVLRPVAPGTMLLIGASLWPPTPTAICCSD